MQFYYFNEGEINKQYGKIVPYIVDSFKVWTSKTKKAKGKLSLGPFLKFIGITLGDIEGDFEWGKTANVEEVKSFSDEQKMTFVWKYLKDNNQLKIVTSNSMPELEIGERILFEAQLEFIDHPDGGAKFEVKVCGKKFYIFFSKSNIPRTILNILKFKSEPVPLSGYRIISNIDEKCIVIRPYAFGLDFLQTWI